MPMVPVRATAARAQGVDADAGATVAIDHDRDNVAATCAQGAATTDRANGAATVDHDQDVALRPCVARCPCRGCSQHRSSHSCRCFRRGCLRVGRYRCRRRASPPATTPLPPSACSALLLSSTCSVSYPAARMSLPPTPSRAIASPTSVDVLIGLPVSGGTNQVTTRFTNLSHKGGPPSSGSW
jgi:hypothetical protein